MTMNQSNDTALRITTIALFSTLAYAWSWCWWLPVVKVLIDNGGNLNTAPAWVLPAVLAGGYGPSVAGAVMVIRESGLAGFKRLLSRFLRWRAPVVVHLAVWLWPSLLLVGAMFLSQSDAAQLGTLQWANLSLIPTVLLSSVFFGPLGEELGWRGYLLPTLQRRYSALISSVTIGVIWCFWHLPLFWSPAGTLVSGQPVTLFAIAKYLAFTCSISVVFTWVFNSSRGSVLLPVILHTTFNSALPFVLFPYRDPAASLNLQWLSILPTAMAVVVLARLYGEKSLSSRERET